MTKLLFILLAAHAASAVRKPVASASFGGNEIRLYAHPLAYDVSRDGTILVPKTVIDVKLGSRCHVNESPRSVMRGAHDGSVATPVYKKSSVDLSGEEAVVYFGDIAVRLVARSDGVAYRFELKKPAVVEHEQSDVTIPVDARCWFNRTTRHGLEETVPEFSDASALKHDEHRGVVYLPFVYTVGGKTAAILESDVHDYPTWNLSGFRREDGGVLLEANFAGYPSKESRVAYERGTGKRTSPEVGGRLILVDEREDFIAKSDAPRALPWRCFALADSPSALCESDLVYALAEPRDPDADFSWVKPGKVAWDWWNCFDNRLTDPANEGCNTKTYERFIDFAAKHGIEYVAIDGERWYDEIVWIPHPAVDVPHLVEYADARGVGIILWIAWAQVCGDEERIAEHFAKVGAKGFKIDFIERGDAEAMAFVERFAAACARHKMLVDFHGSSRPTGLQRKYPNVVNYEAVHGLEQMKWHKGDGRDMMASDVAAFFLRMTAGPLDYTPGAMLNFPVGGGYDGKKADVFPGSIGTRCRQIAMMALYEAPLQMLADSPTNYERNPESLAFMAAVPTVWDATVGLAGGPESVAAVARKARDGSWYASAITDAEARDYALDTSFLGAGEWKAEIFRDAPDADKEPTRCVHETRAVKAGEVLRFRLAPGGGVAARFTR